VSAASDKAGEQVEDGDRLGDLFAQRQLGGVPEPGEQVVITGDCLLVAAESAIPEPFVIERFGDLFAQRQLGGVPKPGEQVVEDGDCLWRATAFPAKPLKSTCR
jgi:hypothetical protein